MQDKNLISSTEPEDEVNIEWQEALAAYFESHNGGEVSAIPTARLTDRQQADWLAAQALLGIPERALEVRPSVETAWQSFRAARFEVAPTSDAVSLGSYVARHEQTTLKDSGLSPATVEALKADPTPLETLRGYELNDYAALARRYDVKDSAFPRMLKWLKALGKSLTLPTANPARGMMFAREDEVRTPGLSEAELLESLQTETDE